MSERCMLERRTSRAAFRTRDMMTMALGIVVVLTLLFWFGLARQARAQRSAPLAHRPSVAALDDWAKTARASINASSIRGLTDEVLNRSLLASSPSSIRDRLFRAEVGFRNGHQ